MLGHEVRAAKAPPTPENVPGTASISTGVPPVALVAALAPRSREIGRSGQLHDLPTMDTAGLILRVALGVLGVPIWAA